MFHRYVASIVYRCCKSRSGCCTSCNGYTRMFQVYVTNVSSAPDECCKCFYLDVAKVDLDVAYTCMLQAYVSRVSYVCLRVFYPDVAYVCNGFQMFSGVSQVFSDAYFKCFICLLLCVAIFVSECFKNRSGVANGMCMRSGRRRGRRSGRRG
jgi:hypothetical protein